MDNFCRILQGWLTHRHTRTTVRFTYDPDSTEQMFDYLPYCFSSGFSQQSPKLPKPNPGNLLVSNLQSLCISLSNRYAAEDLKCVAIWGRVGHTYPNQTKGFTMPICVTLKCTNEEMTYVEREQEFSVGWVGITMYGNICSNCFNQLKEMDN